MHNQIQLSIIIVSYSNCEDLLECIKSIYFYNDIGDGLELIVVDHSPNNHLYNVISQSFADCLNFRIIKHKNEGFGSGNNFGADFANGHILAFLNPDTLLIEPIFKKIIDFFDLHSKIGMLGLKLMDVNRKSNKSFDWVDRIGFFKNQLMKIYNKRNSFDEKSMYTEGADIFVKKDVFYKVGKFDENIFMYYEEPDLVHRMHNFNYVNYYNSNLHIIHKEGGSNISSKFSITEKMKSHIYYCNKYNLNYRIKLKYERRLCCFKMILMPNRAKYFCDYIAIINEYL